MLDFLQLRLLSKDGSEERSPSTEDRRELHVDSYGI
jgi:hypothetical protein